MWSVVTRVWINRFSEACNVLDTTHALTTFTPTHLCERLEVSCGLAHLFAVEQQVAVASQAFGPLAAVILPDRLVGGMNSETRNKIHQAGGRASEGRSEAGY